MFTPGFSILFTENLATHSLTIDGGEPVYGFFSREYDEESLGRSSVAGTKPVFKCSAEVAETVQGLLDGGDAVTVAVSGQTGNFTVAHVEDANEAGAARLILKVS